MAHGDFVWCDVSSRRLDVAKDFYRQLFGWHYETLTGTPEADYTIASSQAGPAAGLFTMPETFQTLGMPCFWMSYIAVSSVDRAIADGTHFGGKVELGPVDQSDGSRIALIRDPLGAGFTVVEGGDFVVRHTKPTPGQMAWNALYVSEAAAVIDFYVRLFDWQFTRRSDNATSYDIANGSGQRVSTLHELPTDLRGREQYWGVHFAVDDLETARQRIVAAGGNYQWMSEGNAFARDPDDAMLFLDRAD